MMSKVIEFPAERISKGVHTYYPEMKERKVTAQIEARLSYYGKHYFLYTTLELKGRGIVQNESSRPELKSYMVTTKAFDKLKQLYSVSLERLLD
ncbi:hypothetical protein [Paenibacillus sp. NRS-1760]|uniref:hypothetical protein n=1 Tax=Paenibacillus sp. NRS-1760 TaxID=3233902 RepID=UPI003D2AE2DC